MANLDEAVNEAKPGLKAVSTQTVPAVNQLIRDLGDTAASLRAISGRIDNGGASSLLGSPKLPDYTPRK